MQSKKHISWYKVLREDIDYKSKCRTKQTLEIKTIGIHKEKILRNDKQNKQTSNSKYNSQN